MYLLRKMSKFMLITLNVKNQRGHTKKIRKRFYLKKDKWENLNSRMKIKDEHDFNKRRTHSEKRCWKILEQKHKSWRVQKLNFRFCFIHGWKKTDWQNE